MVFQSPPCHPLFFVLRPRVRRLRSFPAIAHLSPPFLAITCGAVSILSISRGCYPRSFVYCPGIACRSSHLAVYSSPLPWRRAAGFVHSAGFYPPFFIASISGGYYPPFFIASISGGYYPPFFIASIPPDSIRLCSSLSAPRDSAEFLFLLL